MDCWKMTGGVLKFVRHRYSPSWKQATTYVGNEIDTGYLLRELTANSRQSTMKKPLFAIL